MLDLSARAAEQHESTVEAEQIQHSFFPFIVEEGAKPKRVPRGGAFA
jgi:hypothetical protein